ncbi:MAG: hypothetical protein H6502_01960 [Candidatus Woesearchaeota archaeon]|nr:MAG: hypothetical protein H6502_01960 [Candidatus Woesearchaeota archaeon]
MKRKAFCVECGREIDSGIFCLDHKPSAPLKPLLLKKTETGKYFHRNKWSQFSSDEEALGVLVKETNKDASFVRIEEDHVVLTREGEEFRVPLEIEKLNDPALEKLGTNYFEGILQLRNATNEVLDFVHEKVAAARHRGVGINKIVEEGNGANLYFTKKSYLPRLGQALIRKFGGQMKSSPQLFSVDKQSGKNLYRLNVYVELPLFSVGDVLAIKNAVYQIRRTAKLLYGVKLATGKTHTFPYEGLEAEKLKKQRLPVATTQPEVTVIDPENLDSVVVKNAEGEFLIGKKVKVVVFNKEAWLVR